MTRWHVDDSGAKTYMSLSVDISGPFTLANASGLIAASSLPNTDFIPRNTAAT